MPRKAPMATCPVRIYTSHRLSIASTDSVSGIYLSKRDATPGIPRINDAPPIMRFSKLGTIVDINKTYTHQYSGADDLDVMPWNKLFKSRTGCPPAYSENALNTWTPKTIS